MHRHDEFDRESVISRISVFRDQIERRLAGEITEEQFGPMRRMNGVHLCDHAYILRVPLPRGVLSSRQFRMLAHVARLYDRGYAHFTESRSAEFHWPALSSIPSMLADLASVGLYPAGAGSGHIADSPPRRPGHAAITIPLAGTGNISDSQMEVVAGLAETYGSGEVHVGRGQDLAVPHVASADLASVRACLAANGLWDRRRSDPAPAREAHDAREVHAA